MAVSKKIRPVSPLHLIPLIRQYVVEHWLVWARFALIACSIGGAAAIGFLAGKKNPLYALVAAALPMVFVGAETFVRTNEYWPIYILFVAAYLPFGLPTGTGSLLVLSLILTIVLVGIWIVQMILNKRFWLYPSLVNAPLLGFSLTVLVSLVWSNVFRDPLVFTSRSFPIVQIASGIVMVMLPSAFLMVANFTQSLRNLRVMVVIMLSAGTVGLVARFLSLRLPVNTDGLSAMWFIGLAVGLAYFDRSLSWKVKALLWAVAVGWIVWGFGMHISWLAGWFPGMLVLGFLTLRKSFKLALLIGAIGMVWIALHADYYLGTVLGNESTESGETRLAAWEMNWLVTGDHLLFGTGPAGYAAYYMSYFPTQAMATHNNFLDILSQTGITGTFFCIWFFLSLIVLGFRLCRRLRGRGDFAEALANTALAGTIGGLVMMAFGDWLFPFAYTQTIAGYNYAVYCWLFMGSLVVLDRLTSSEQVRHA